MALTMSKLKIISMWFIAIVTITLVVSMTVFNFLYPNYFYIVYHPDVYYIGDSLCEGPHDEKGPSSPQIARIGKDCIGGRKSVDYGSLPKGKTIIFYALGANDVGSTPVDVYREDLQKKFAESDAEMIICPMPDNLKVETEPYRQVMKDLCDETIEVRDHGYYFSAKDGIHGSADDHRRFGEWLNTYVDQLLEAKPWKLDRHTVKSTEQ